MHICDRMSCPIRRTGLWNYLPDFLDLPDLPDLPDLSDLSDLSDFGGSSQFGGFGDATSSSRPLSFPWMVASVSSVICLILPLLRFTNS